MKIKLLNLMYFNILSIMTIFIQSFYLSYTENNNKIPDIRDTLIVRGTMMELVTNISKSFTYYMKYTFYIYFVILIVTILSTFLFRFGYKQSKILGDELILQKQVVLLNIVVNLIIISHNIIHTDLIFPKYDSQFTSFLLYVITTPVNIILYIMIVSYFVNNYSLNLMKVTSKITKNLEKYPLNWIY